MEFAFSGRASRLLLSAVLVVLIPVAGFSGGQSIQPPQFTSGNSMIFDVRNGDQEGKLILKERELAFESLTDARHSRNWKYSDIRELSRRKKEFSVRPFRGDKYSFQFKNKQSRDHVYDLISQRILAARQEPK